MANQDQIPQQQDSRDQPERPTSPIPFAPVEQAVDKPVVKAPKSSSKSNKKDSKRKKPGAKTGSSKIQTKSKSKATKDGSSKVPIGSQSGHFKTMSSSALDINPSQPPASTYVDVGMHKEDQQAAGGPTSLGVTSEEGAHPQLSSGMSASNLTQPIFSASFIIHSEFASGHDASADSTAEADSREFAPHDFIPQQKSRDEGTKNYTLDHIFTGTNLNVLADKTKSVSKGLETVLTTPETGKEARILQNSLMKSNSKISQSCEVDEEDKDKGIHADSNSQKRKLKLEKNKVEAEVALLLAQPSFPDVTHLTELLVKFLKLKFSKILSTHDFSSSLPTELKELPSKFNELTKEVKGLKKHVHELEIKLPGDLKDIPPKLEEFTKIVISLTSQVAITSASKKTEDTSIPSAGQADTQPAEGEKNTNQTTISHPPKSSSQTEGEHIKTNKGKKVVSLKDVEEESSNSESDDTINLTGSRVESSRTKKLKKFDFFTEDGDHVHLTEDQIQEQKRIEESVKAEAAKHEVEVRNEELVDLLGPDVVSKYYKANLQYDKYCDKMLNRRAKSRITNCDVLTKKGPISLKVYREDGTSEVIPNFKSSDFLHPPGDGEKVLKAFNYKNRKRGCPTIYEKIQTRMDCLHETKAALGIDLDKPLSEQDPLNKLNDLANKKQKHADDIHDYFRANKRLKSSIQYEDHPA
ncbi:hypothetical protein Tco_0804747 [Tanacetum coccineum]|uniref:Uncharacterized protein n=1 Tax=Tanacetum coccineum TaxID=301880 RepID=A0ABQ5A563_9ASTR